MPTEENIELRSDEVQEIMSRTPNWMIRRGMTLIFLLIALFLFMAWFIQYPDVISGNAIITTTTPPLRLIAKSGGELNAVLIADNASVKKGQTIASINSTLSTEAHSYLVTEVELIRKLVQQNQPETYRQQQTAFVFGELESQYLGLMRALGDYTTFLQNNTLSFSLTNTSRQISNQKQLYQLTEKELSHSQQLANNAARKFEDDRILFDKGVISQADFFERERAHKHSVSEMHALERSKIQTAIAITELEKQLHLAQTDFDRQRQALLVEMEQQLANLENALTIWQQSYLITSPVDGTVSYLQSLSTNQFITSGTSLFAILPENERFVAQLEIPKLGYGKVQKGQQVLLKLDNFPFQEYGQLKGTVEHISLIPDEDRYLVRVTLPEELISTYNKRLAYTPEMSGTAEIITEDLRITDRIFNSLRKVFE